MINGLLIMLIVNSGCVSFEVVVNLDIMDFIFFVVDGIGGYVFVKMLIEYNCNVVVWCKIECECNNN